MPLVVTANDRPLAAGGTNIGDATAGGGLAAAFDGTQVQAIAAAAQKTFATFLYVGKTLPAPGAKVIRRGVLIGTSDQGYVSGANPNVTPALYGRGGAAPANSTDGTQLGTSAAFADTANESGTPRGVAASVIQPVDHVWLRASHPGGVASMGIAEAMFFEDWSPLDDLPADYTLENPLIGYRSVFDEGDVSATSEEAANPATNLANPSTSLKWRATSSAEQFITIDVSAAGAGGIDYVGVAGHNWFSAGVSPSVEGRDGTNPFVEIVQAIALTDDGPLLVRFANVTYDEVRIRLPAGSIAPEAAVVYAGRLLVAQRRIYVPHVPITMGREVNAVAPLSESGSFLGRTVLGQHSATEIALRNLTADWVRDELDPFLEAALEHPFFWAWRPGTYPHELGFVWLPPGEFPRPENQLSNGMMQVTVPVMGITT